MAFTPKVWHDRPDLSTPITAAALEDLETRLAAYSDTKLGLSAYHLAPSGDVTGVTDDNNFNVAVSALPNGGVIYLMANFGTPFYTKTGWVLPAQTTSGQLGGGPICLQGVGMPILQPVGNNLTGIFHHRTSTYGNPAPAPYQTPVGWIRDLVIDGTLATGASHGFSCGDGSGRVIENVWCKNFTGAGASGALFTNTLISGDAFFSEKGYYRIHLLNNTDGAFITAGTGSSSWEYNRFEFFFHKARQDQRGIVIHNASVTGGEFRWLGNFESTTGSTVPVAGTGPNAGKTIGALCFENGGGIWRGQLYAKWERNPTGGGGPHPYSLFSDGTDNSGIRECSGQITTGTNSGSLFNGAECSFNGRWGNGEGLPAPRGTVSPTAGHYTLDSGGWGAGAAFPGLGNEWDNWGPDCLVSVAGGNVTSIRVNDIVTGATSGTFHVPSRGRIKVFGTVAPTTWAIIPINQAQF